MHTRNTWEWVYGASVWRFVDGWRRNENDKERTRFVPFGWLLCVSLCSKPFPVPATRFGDLPYDRSNAYPNLPSTDGNSCETKKQKKVSMATTFFLSRRRDAFLSRFSSLLTASSGHFSAQMRDARGQRRGKHNFGLSFIEQMQKIRIKCLKFSRTIDYFREVTRN